MFRGSAEKLRFRPANGMDVTAIGRVTVYPRDGVYQLYVNAMIPQGIGDLYAAFEQLTPSSPMFSQSVLVSM